MMGILQRFYEMLQKKSARTGMVLVLAGVIANILNLVFNSYLTQRLSVAEVGNLGLYSSLFYLSMIPLGALGGTVTYLVSYFEGKYGKFSTIGFWRDVNWRATTVAVLVSSIWFIISPILPLFFPSTSLTMYLLFVPVIFLGTLTYIDRGLLTGRKKFLVVSIIIVVDALSKLLFAVLTQKLSLESYVYLAYPFGMMTALLISRIWIVSEKRKATVVQRKIPFSTGFFFGTLLADMAKIFFLSFDVLLAKHFLNPEIAGYYALLSLVGKAVFFSGSLALQFMIPVAGKREGALVDTLPVMKILRGLTVLFSLSAVIILGIFAPITLPLFFGNRAQVIVPYALWFAIGMACYVISQVYVSYHLVKKSYIFSLIPFIYLLIEVFSLSVRHDTIGDFVTIVTVIGVLNLCTAVYLHHHGAMIVALQNNIAALKSLFLREKSQKVDAHSLRFLLFNWRDTQHIWSGGAEVYVHNLAKELVEQGHAVTIFAGNDGNSKNRETVDGIDIIRRGGFFTVYFWAVIYYLLKLRNRYDIVIDSENGVPFFTPLFVRTETILLIHHVHQEIFRNYLPKPFALLAQFIEKQLMPSVYATSNIITVSESSKQDIINLGFHPERITIVSPGFSPLESKTRRAKKPTFLYLGRLKPYKNVDVAIKAFSSIEKTHPEARLVIAGEGESLLDLENLVRNLGLTRKVTFYGRVTERQKASLYKQAWVALQPSEMEGWGITVIEANYYGTPVIASNVPGLKDSVIHGKTGMLVKAKRVHLFAEEMSRLISDRALLASLSKQSQKWSKRFTWQQSVQIFLSQSIQNHTPQLGSLVLPVLSHERMT